MLGVVIGVVASGVILTFLNKDPTAVQRNREEKAKLEKQKEEQEKKMEEARQKVVNDPVAIQKREEKKKELKEKMFKSLTEQQRKALQEFIEEKRNDGKTDQQIMKQAGTKAFLFLFFVLLALVFAIVGIVIIAGGDVSKISSLFDQAKGLFYKFIEWNFPRFTNIGQSSSNSQL